MITGQEIVEVLGFNSEASAEWKAFVGPFKRDFLGPRKDIQKGFQHFEYLGDRSPWDRCIQEMYEAYSDIWSLDKFPGKFGLKTRTKFAHVFLIAWAKKLRQKRKEEASVSGPGSGAGDQGKSGSGSGSESIGGPIPGPGTGRKRLRNDDDDEPSTAPLPKARKQYPVLEFPSFIVVLKKGDDRNVASYQDTVGFADLVSWVHCETQLAGGILAWVDIKIHEPAFADMMGISSTSYRLPTSTQYICDQMSWNAAVLSSQLNCDPTGRFKFLAIETGDRDLIVRGHGLGPKTQRHPKTKSKRIFTI